MSTYIDELHPRAEDGKYTTKEHESPQGGMNALALGGDYWTDRKEAEDKFIHDVTSNIMEVMRAHPHINAHGQSARALIDDFRYGWDDNYSLRVSCGPDELVFEPVREGGEFFYHSDKFLPLDGDELEETIHQFVKDSIERHPLVKHNRMLEASYRTSDDEYLAEIVQKIDEDTLPDYANPNVSAHKLADIDMIDITDSYEAERAGIVFHDQHGRRPDEDEMVEAVREQLRSAKRFEARHDRARMLAEALEDADMPAIVASFDESKYADVAERTLQESVHTWTRMTDDDHVYVAFVRSWDEAVLALGQVSTDGNRGVQYTNNSTGKQMRAEVSVTGMSHTDYTYNNDASGAAWVSQQVLLGDR